MLAAMALLCGRRRRAAAFFVLVTLVMLFLFSSRAGEYFLVRTLEDDFVPLSFRELVDMRNDGVKTAVVVLSGDAVRGSPAGGSLAAEIGEVTLKRLFEGYRVYRVTGFPLCVSGGVEPGAEGLLWLRL
ncbi:MAG: hypothetical protein XD50_1723 [Clostridia bacterium 41_269]|nr:MAG: hypothetical protein XD50_1723 [Clostridia bacterium 41_269]